MKQGGRLAFYFLLSALVTATIVFLIVQHGFPGEGKSPDGGMLLTMCFVSVAIFGVTCRIMASLLRGQANLQNSLPQKATPQLKVATPVYLAGQKPPAGKGPVALSPQKTTNANGCAIAFLVFAIAGLIVLSPAIWEALHIDREKERILEEKAARQARPPVIARSLEVENLEVKQIGSKYRYFFVVRNVEDNPFQGEIRIDLCRKNNASKTGESFRLELGSKPAAANSYVEQNTGLPSVHGEYGIVSFEYRATDNNGNIATGSGPIRQQLTW